jgi:hypothetical protein
VLQNSLKSPFLPSQILHNFLGIFPQIFLPLESLYSISNPILIQKSIKIYFLLLFWISAREMVSARPPPFLSSPAAAHLLPPFQAQPTHRLPLTDMWAHPVSEPGRLLPPEARPGATAATSPVRSRCPDDPSSPRNGTAFPQPLHSPLTPPFPSQNQRIEGLEGAPPPPTVPLTALPPLPCSDPIKGAPSTTAPNHTSSHSLFCLSMPPLAPHRAPTRRRYISPSSSFLRHPTAHSHPR